MNLVRTFDFCPLRRQFPSGFNGLKPVKIYVVFDIGIDTDVLSPSAAAFTDLDQQQVGTFFQVHFKPILVAIDICGCATASAVGTAFL